MFSMYWKIEIIEVTARVNWSVGINITDCIIEFGYKRIGLFIKVGYVDE